MSSEQKHVRRKKTGRDEGTMKMKKEDSVQKKEIQFKKEDSVQKRRFSSKKKIMFKKEDYVQKRRLCSKKEDSVQKKKIRHPKKKILCLKKEDPAHGIVRRVEGRLPSGRPIFLRPDRREAVRFFIQTAS